MMDWYDHGAGWGGGWILMMLFMVAFWGLVVFAVIHLFRGTNRGETGTTQAPRERDPIEILDERLARGDIDVEEYQARRDVLRGAHQAPAH